MLFDPQYLLSNPVDIGSALKELTRSTDRLVVLAEPEPIGVAVTDVNVRQRTFRFRPFTSDDMRTLARRSDFRFQGSAFGAQLAFEAGAPRAVDADDGAGQTVPVLECDFPATLYRMQRREHYRVMARPNSQASWPTSQGGKLKLKIYDVSLGGVGLRSRLGSPELPAVGTRMEKAQLEFPDSGSVTMDLDVVVMRETIEHDFTQGPVRYVHVGCAFAGNAPENERFLERLVRWLETQKTAR